MTAHSASGWIERLYDELYAQAERSMRAEREGHTLQPTALVNEAFVRLASSSNPAWQSKAHFLAAAATVFRRVLVDHARRRNADKRSPGLSRVNIDDTEPAAPDRQLDLVGLDELLTKLEVVDARSARFVELKFFGGLTHDQIADFLGISLSTAEADWRFARAWLAERLSDDGPPCTVC